MKDKVISRKLDKVIASINEYLLIEGLDKSGLESSLVILKRFKHLLNKLQAVRLESSNLSVQYKEALEEHCLLVMINKEGIIFDINQAFCESLGYQKSEIIGKNFSFFKSGIHTRDFYKSLWETLLTGKVWAGEVCNRRKDGSLCWHQVTNIPILLIDGKIDYFLSLRTEITPFKSQTQQLLKLNETANIALQRENQINALIGHELRTPLNGILGMAELLLLNDSFDSDTVESLKTIQNCGEHLLNIVNQLLNYSEIKNDQAKLNFSPTTIKDLLEPIINTYQALAKQKNLELILESPDLNKAVFLDIVKQRQIFSNLILNAIQFTNKGSVIVRVALEEDVTNGFSTLVSEIIDTGCGMPESIKQQIIESFSQAVDYKRREYGGLGLGLTIAHELMLQLGGTFKIISKENQGTTIRLRAPYLQEVNQELKATRYNWNTLSQKRILIIENNFLVRKMLTMFFASLGNSVDLALTVQEGLARYRETPFDLILIDIELTSFQGLSAIQAFRLAEEELMIKSYFIGLFNHNKLGNGEEVVKSLILNYDAYLGYPINKYELKTILSNLFLTDRQKT